VTPRPTSERLRPNPRRLLTLVECSGPVTRAELAALSGLPVTTVAGVVAEMLQRGLLAEVVPDAGPRGAGRPARTLVPATPPRVVGVIAHRGGDLHAAVVGLTGLPIGGRSEPVPPQDPAAAGHAHPPGGSLEVGARLLDAALRDTGISAQRLAGVVVSAARPRPAELDLAPLRERFDAPVMAENDANLGALGESSFGAGRGLDSFVYVMLGHGVGAGMVFGGRLHRGAAGFAGELAHVQVRDQEDGPLCVCGGRGCLAQVMGPSLHEFVRRAYARRLSVPEVLSLAADREPGVRRTFSDLGRTVGRPLADLCTMLDPAAVVIDGSLGAAGEPVMAGIREAIDRHAAPAVADSVRVLAGELGERAEVLGGVVLVRQRSLDER
jgi:predicted NBD/HSP70 family sugar kinase